MNNSAFDGCYCVFSGELRNFNKYSAGDVDTVGSVYDFESLLHYGNKAFSNNGKPTLLAIKDPELQFGGRTKLSKSDIMMLNTLYDCSSMYMDILKICLITNHQVIIIVSPTTQASSQDFFFFGGGGGRGANLKYRDQVIEVAWCWIDRPCKCRRHNGLWEVLKLLEIH